MIGLKHFVLSTIPRNFVLHHCVKENKNFEQQRNILSVMHQNLINTSLYEDGNTNIRVYIKMKLIIKFPAIPLITLR